MKKVYSYIKLRSCQSEEPNHGRITILNSPSTRSTVDSEETNFTEQQQIMHIQRNFPPYETAVFKCDGIFPAISTNQEYYAGCGKNIVTKLKVNRQPCVLLVYGAKGSGKTTSLYGNGISGFLFRLLQDLHATVMKTSYLLSDSENRVFDLLQENPYFQQDSSASISPTEAALHCEKMRVNSSTSHSKDYTKLVLQPETMIVDFLLLAESNRSIYESHQQSPPQYDTLLTVSLQFHDSETNTIQYSHIHIIEVSDYLALKQWILQEDEQKINAFVAVESTASPQRTASTPSTTGNRTDHGVLKKILRKAKTEDYSIHLVGCIYDDVTRYDENVDSCKFGEFLSQHFSSLSNPNAYYHILCDHVVRLQHDYDHLRDRFAQIELNPMLLLSSPTATTASSITTTSSVVNLPLQDHFEREKQRWLMEISIRDYELLYLRKELELVHYQETSRLIKSEQTTKPSITEVEPDPNPLMEATMISVSDQVEPVNDINPNNPISATTIENLNNAQSVSNLDDSDRLLDAPPPEARLIPPEENITAETMVSSSSDDILSSTEVPGVVPPPATTPTTTTTATTSNQMIQSDAIVIVSRELDDGHDNSNILSSNNTFLMQETVSTEEEEEEEEESDHESITEFTTLDDMDRKDHRVIPHTHAIRCRRCGCRKKSRCTTCSIYFQATIGICTKCIPKHFEIITAPANVDYLIQYVDQERKKKGLEPFDFLRDPEVVKNIPSYQASFGKKDDQTTAALALAALHESKGKDIDQDKTADKTKTSKSQNKTGKSQDQGKAVEPYSPQSARTKAALDSDENDGDVEDDKDYGLIHSNDENHPLLPAKRPLSLKKKVEEESDDDNEKLYFDKSNSPLKKRNKTVSSAFGSQRKRY